MPAPGHPIGGPTKESNARVADYYRDQAITSAREVRRLTDELAALHRRIALPSYVVTIGDKQVSINGELPPGVIEFRNGDSEMLARVEAR